MATLPAQAAPLDATLTLQPVPLAAPFARVTFHGALRGTLVAEQVVVVSTAGGSAIVETDVNGVFSATLAVPGSGTYEVRADYTTLAAAGVEAHAAQTYTVARPPPPPAGFAATPAPDALAADLSWSRPATTPDAPISGYRVYERGTDGRWTLLATTSALSMRDPSGVGSQPTYRATAFGLGGESAPSPESQATQPAPSVPVVAVTASARGANVSWSASGAEAFVVVRTDPNGARRTLGTYGAATTSLDDALTSAGNYTYEVDAENLGGLSAGQATAYVAPLNMPSNFTATPLPAPVVQLRWDPPQSGATVEFYRIYRADGAGTPVLLTSATATAWDDVNVSRKSTYTYLIDASENHLASPKTPAITVTVPMPVTEMAVTMPGFSYCIESTGRCGTTGNPGGIIWGSPDTFYVWPHLDGRVVLNSEYAANVAVSGTMHGVLTRCSSTSTSCDPPITIDKAWTATTDANGNWSADVGPWVYSSGQGGQGSRLDVSGSATSGPATSATSGRFSVTF